MTALKAPRRQALKFGPDALNSATLPPHYYFDPAIFAAEREKIFLKTWQYAGLREDVPKPGDYFTAEIQDQKIFVTRGKDGRLRAFHNVCMHRGHILVEGKGSKAIFTCPFHAWSYDATGALKAAGNAENVQGFRLEDFGLAEIKVETLGPLVLVNLDPEAAAIGPQATGLAEHWRANVKYFDRLTLRHRQDYQVKCNWKLIADQNECYHCPAIHAGVTTVQGGPAAWITTEHAIWSTHLIRANDDVTQARLAALKAPHDPDKWQNEAFIWYLWPNLIFVTHQAPTNFKILHFLPTGVESSVETLYCFTLDPPTADDQANIERFATVVQGQDLEAMEKQQTGLHARGYQRGRLMVDKERSWRSEHSVHHFDKMVWEALNGPNY